MHHYKIELILTQNVDDTFASHLIESLCELEGNKVAYWINQLDTAGRLTVEIKAAWPSGEPRDAHTENTFAATFFLTFTRAVTHSCELRLRRPANSLNSFRIKCKGRNITIFPGSIGSNSSNVWHHPDIMHCKNTFYEVVAPVICFMQ